MEIYAPSGLRCEARPFKGREIMAIVEALEETESMGNDAMLELLNGTWLSTLDVGPYAKLEGAERKPNWQSEVVKNDLLGLLLSLRVGSFPDGHLYEFPVRCEGPGCRHRIIWGCNITEHILSRVRELPEPGRRYLESGEPIVHNVAGTEVRFRLPTLQSEVPMLKWIKQMRKRKGPDGRKARRTRKQTVIDRMAAQIIGLEFNGVVQKPTVPRAHAFVMDLDAPDLYDLREAMDLADVQIDSEITVKCDECDWEFETDIPLTQSFLDPGILGRRARWFGHLDAEPELASQSETQTS